MTFFWSSRLNICSVVAYLNENRKVGLHTYNNCMSLLPIYWIYHLLLKVSSSFHIHFHSLLFVLYGPVIKLFLSSFVCIFARFIQHHKHALVNLNKCGKKLCFLIKYLIRYFRSTLIMKWYHSTIKRIIIQKSFC